MVRAVQAPLKNWCTYSCTVIIQQRIKTMETSIERGKWGEIDCEQKSRVLTIATREFQKKLCKDQKIIWQRGEKNWVLDARRRAAASQFIPGGCLKRWKGHEMLAAQISFPKGVANKFNNPVQRDFNYKISRRFIHITKTTLSTHTHTHTERE